MGVVAWRRMAAFVEFSAAVVESDGPPSVVARDGGPHATIEVAARTVAAICHVVARAPSSSATHKG